jgi:predicted Rossmann fold nucleotide-binding protein DprA/Smf involved in DNA uptake
MRIPANWRTAIGEGRLRILSPFPAGKRRATAELAEARNEFVASQAAELLVLHAAPSSRTEALALRALDSGKPVYVLDDEHNQRLFGLGATPVSPRSLPEHWKVEGHDEPSPEAGMLL